MVRRHTRALGTEREVTEELLEDYLADVTTKQDRLALLELVQPADAERASVRFERADERLATYARFLAALASRRPVLVWLDDVQWSAVALRLVSGSSSAARSTAPRCSSC